MKKIKIVATFFLLFFTFLTIFLYPLQAGVIRDSISGDLEFRAYYDQISGNEDLSFKTEGFNYLTDLYLYYQPSREETNGVQYRGMLYLQGTDDPQYQTRGDNWRLQNVYLTATRPEKWEMTGGYFSNRYTRYTMNSTLLGINGWFKPTENFRMRLFSGREHRARSSEQHARYAGGVRAEVERFDNHLLGFNYVRSKDHKSSLDDGELDGVSDTAANEVYSFDYTGSFFEKMLEVDGEVAMSEGDTDSSSSGGDYDNEKARRIRIRLRPLDKTRLTGRYEKVDPGFETLQGFASTNRKRYEFGLSQDISNNWDLGVDYITWEDGLGDEIKTKEIKNWRTRTAYRNQSDFLGDQEWSLSFEKREDDESKETDENIWEVGLDNRFSRKHRINIYYSYEEDDADSDQLGLWRVGYNGRFEPYEFPVDYDFNTEYREDEDKTVSGLNTDRRIRVENNLTLGRGRRESLALFHHYQKEKTAGLDDVFRTSYGAGYTYLFSRETGNSLSLLYEVNDIEDKEDPTRDYKEKSIELNTKVSF
ncbi:MAG: hypothetical protein ACLFN5_05285 [bacterium]